MKRYIVALIYMALCMPLVSCDKEVQEQYGDSSAYLPISDMKNLYPLGDSVNVSFTSDSSWSLTRDKKATWLSFNKESGGAGTTDLEITIKPYIVKDEISEKPATRKATIVFTTETGGERVFEVSQERAYFKIVESNDSTSERNVIDDNISFDWKEEERTYEVESNFNWKLNINNGSVDNATVKVDNSEWDPNESYGIVTNKLSVKVEYNFKERRNNEISFIPDLDDDTAAENEQYDVLRRKLNVSQDYLYLKVVDSSIDDINDPSKHDASCPEDDCFTFDELGNEDKDVVDFYVVYEEDLEYNINIKPSEAALECFEYYEDNSGTCNSKTDDDDKRTINWKKYKAKFTKANPDFVNPRTITCDIKPRVEDVADEDVPDEACRSVKFVQNAYEFNVKDGETDVTKEGIDIDNKGDSKSFTLTTKGDWKISYPKDVTWASLTFSDANGDSIKGEDKGNDIEFSGNGNATIGVEVANRNLSFDLDNVLNLAFEASNIEEDYRDEDEIDPTKNVKLKQPKFEFGIFVNDGKKETNEDFNVSSHTKVEYLVRIVSSGSWKIEEDKDWVEFDGETEQEGNAEKAGNLKFDNNLDVNPREFVLKVISKEHKGVEGYEDNYYRELTITQDEIKKNILEKEGGSLLSTLSCAAYKANDADRRSSFYMQCSAPWTLKEKPEWITLSESGKPLEVGEGFDDGVYRTISLEVENNLVLQNRSGKVSFLVGDEEIGFNVSQDRFVFDGPSFSKTYEYDPIPTGDPDEFEITLTNEAKLGHNIDSWVNFTYNEKESNETTTTYKCSIKPTPNVENLNTDRSGVYNIRVVGTSLTKEITIKQKKFEWQLSTNKFKFPVISDNSFQSVTIDKCTKEGSKRCYDVDFENCKDWLMLSEEDSKDNFLVFKTKSTNANTEKRSGTITFYVKHSSIDEKKYKLSTINVEQEKYTWNVDYKGASFTFDPVYSDSESYKGKIQIESSGSWRVETVDKDEDDMLKKLSQESGTGGKKEELTFTINPNHTDKDRSVKIEIINDDLDASSKESFTFTQKAYVFEAEKKSVKLDATKDSTASVSITSSGSKGWTFEVDPVSSNDWLDVKNEDGKLVVKTQSKNTTKKDRSATITVTDKTSGRTITITVTQKG